MSGSVVFHPSAEEDVRQAYRWYEEQRKGLGEDFLLCIEAAINAIKESPLSFPAIHKNARRILTRRFPYSIFYVASGATITIVAVFHCHRAPILWRNRT
ncbi:MAG: type II toxin-antitoxin system RelE/ParE family toxin [Nitrospinae bacterium]|nr:type II toxin-antitoxin system RelE/ParE family toxin [Nitrospinota bacterium]